MSEEKKEKAKMGKSGGQKKGVDQSVRPKETPEDILKRKMIEVANPMSLVIAPKTREGHAMIKIAMRYDKAINRLRLNGGTTVAISAVMSCLEKAREFHGKMNALLTSLSDGSGISTFMSSQMDTPDTRLLLAQQRSSYVYLPSTSEGREMMYMIKRLDPLLVQYRTTCDDYEKVGRVVRVVLQTISSFSDLTMYLSKTINYQYEPPKNMNWVLRQMGEIENQAKTVAALS
ncbi:MAG TPA: hypothetical protein PLB95_00650 [Syntrophales bacterium]|mgnify:CR=1 FL=1|nr:hypothetical protein [Syntrophorhabdaceae bacterium]HPX80380.1 hypothetical protein [Syntrophales bacterium]HQM82988.1 hypothetical protein [Syntrophorhabdaceae bacterium]